jgi:NADPH:quinone reductase-like Zn-dependent oxidoreductase
MKAAVMNPEDGILRYTEWPDPVVTHEDQVLMQVKAAAIKNVDRSIASGTHYSSETNEAPQARVIGSDGVGLLPDGRRVYAIGIQGMVAQQALVLKDRMVVLPDGLDDAKAAALPNAVIGAAMALRFKAEIKDGHTVLINGATGVTGRIAVQLARYYGARKVIGTGRNPESLQALLALGADEVISLQQNDHDFFAQIQALHSSTPLDSIIDYLWGHSAELLLLALKGKGSFTHQTRFVSVGSMSGDILQLSAQNLRSVNLQLQGSGLGSWTRQETGRLFLEILPEMFQLAASGKLLIETVVIPVTQIETAYDLPVPDGKRLVIQMN